MKGNDGDVECILFLSPASVVASFFENVRSAKSEYLLASSWVSPKSGTKKLVFRHRASVTNTGAITRLKMLPGPPKKYGINSI